MKGKGVNKKVLQGLAKAGAFDCIESDRIELLKNLDDVNAGAAEAIRVCRDTSRRIRSVKVEDLQGGRGWEA